MREPATPREMLEHLASLPVWDGILMPDDIRTIIREFNRLAGLDRSLHDLRENAADAAVFLRQMGEEEL